MLKFQFFFIYISFVFFHIFSITAFSQTAFNENQAVKVTLEDETIQADNIKIKVTDRKTNKSALIELNRLGPNSSVFVGYYVLNFSSQQQLSELISNHKKLKIEKVELPANQKINSASLSSTVVNKAALRTSSMMSLQEQFLQKQIAMENLSDEQKLRLKEKAKFASEQAMQHYNASQYPQANQKFKEATDLDPSNAEYLFKYGVSLHQSKDYTQSIAILSAIDDESVSEAERNYFLGLNYYRLNETERSINHFNKVIESEDKDLGSTAAFYNGVTQFNLNQLQSAKTNFEYVLDNSNDKELDQQADLYLDKIQAIEQFEKQNKYRWKYNLFTGPVYDQNILNVTTANSPIDQAGYRLYYGGSLEYRPYLSLEKEWSLHLSVSDMYTYSTKFKTEDTLQAADPLSTGFKTTYKLKNFNFKKPMTLSITPGIDGLMMRNTGATSRSFISSSTYLQLNPFIVQTEKWFGSYTLEYRQDNSFLKDVSDTDDLSGSKYTLSTSQIFVYNKEKSQSILTDLGYTTYNAKGDNQKYNKANLAFTFVTPWKWSSVTSYRLDYTTTDYPKNSSDRKDQVISGSWNGSKPLSENWNASLSLTYSSSSSNVDSYDYTKFQVFNIYTYSGAF